MYNTTQQPDLYLTFRREVPGWSPVMNLCHLFLFNNREHSDISCIFPYVKRIEMYSWQMAHSFVTTSSTCLMFFLLNKTNNKLLVVAVVRSNLYPSHFGRTRYISAGPRGLGMPDEPAISRLGPGGLACRTNTI